MKKEIIFFKKVVLLLVILFSFFALQGCVFSKKPESYLRIHIRANSNLEIDQNIKYQIKDSVITYLTPYIASSKNLQEVKVVLNSNLKNIEKQVDTLLKNKNFSYSSKVFINNEFFPTRYYDDVLLEANYYDALIIELGDAKGDNWWCVVYPPLCFINNGSYGNQIIYKSKILEIINNYFK